MNPLPSFQYLPNVEGCHSGLRGRQPLDCLLFQWRVQRVPGNRMPLKNRILVWNQYFEQLWSFYPVYLFFQNCFYLSCIRLPTRVWWTQRNQAQVLKLRKCLNADPLALGIGVPWDSPHHICLQTSCIYIKRKTDESIYFAYKITNMTLFKNKNIPKLIRWLRLW